MRSRGSLKPRGDSIWKSYGKVLSFYDFLFFEINTRKMQLAVALKKFSDGSVYLEMP